MEILGRDPSAVLKKKIGEAFSDKEIVALQLLNKQSAMTIRELAATAKKSDLPEDQMALMESVTRHQLLQGAYSQATAEAGRALRALQKWKEVWSQEDIGINERVKSLTGRTLYQMKQITDMFASADTVEKVSKLGQDMQKRSFGRMLTEFWINNLLSGIPTHVTYTLAGELLSLTKAVPDTAAAAAIGSIRKAMGQDRETVRFGEIGAALKGHWQALSGPAEKAFVQGVKSQAAVLLPGESPKAGIFAPGSEYLTREHLDEAAKFADVIGEAHGLIQGMKDGFVANVDLIKAGGIPGESGFGVEFPVFGANPNITYKGATALPLGELIRSPGRLISGFHSFLKAINYSSIKNAEAYRSVANDPTVRPEDFVRTVADRQQNPTQEIMEKAVAGSIHATLMGQGGEFTKALGRLTNAYINLPILGETQILKFIDPFVHISSNVIEQALLERTPIGILAPEIRAELSGKRGPIAQDQAIGRMLVGTATGLTFGGLAAAGAVTGSGPTDPKVAATWRVAGYQPHSVLVGDIWYDMHRLGPLGMLASVSADMYDVAHSASQGDMVEAGTHLMHAISQNILDESFMRGPSDLIKAVDQPGRYGGKLHPQFPVVICSVFCRDGSVGSID